MTDCIDCGRSPGCFAMHWSMIRWSQAAGMSKRISLIGFAVSVKCRRINYMALLASNGGRPVIAWYIVAPKEYMSVAVLTLLPSNCSGAM